VNGVTVEVVSGVAVVTVLSGVKWGVVSGAEY
jgi:hypothetical protein